MRNKRILYPMLGIYTSPIKTMVSDAVKYNQKQILEEPIAPLSNEEVCQAYIGEITSKYTIKSLRDHYGMDLPYQLEFVKVIYAKMIYGTNNVKFIFKTLLILSF